MGNSALQRRRVLAPRLEARPGRRNVPHPREPCTPGRALLGSPRWSRNHPQTRGTASTSRHLLLRLERIRDCSAPRRQSSRVPIPCLRGRARRQAADFSPTIVNGSVLRGPADYSALLVDPAAPPPVWATGAQATVHELLMGCAASFAERCNEVPSLRFPRDEARRAALRYGRGLGADESAAFLRALEA